MDRISYPRLRAALPWHFLSLLLLLAASGCSAAPPLPSALPTAPPTPDPFAGLEVWDILILSDSSNWGAGDPYGKLVAADRGVQVNVNECIVGGLSAAELLEGLKDAENKKCAGHSWGDRFREAEVIVIFGNPQGSPPPDGSWEGPNAWGACLRGSIAYQGGDAVKLAAFQEQALQSCAPQTFSSYQDTLGEIYSRIYDLRQGRPVILKATDFYIPLHSSWTAGGVNDVCTACLANLAEAVRQAAEDSGVTLVSTMAGFNGPDFMDDPVEMGFIHVDGIHPSAAGGELVARLLQASGYATATR
jgi:hypothetical protein